MFVTGKGEKIKETSNLFPKLYYGKIRLNITSWAITSEIQEKLLYFTRAHQSHGGEGSFYAYLRKKN